MPSYAYDATSKRRDIANVPGTERTHEYQVLAITPKAVVALRHDVGRSCWRIRVEPLSEAAAEEMRPYFPKMVGWSTDSGWKHPDHQPRFSITARDADTRDRDKKLVLALEVAQSEGRIVRRFREHLLERKTEARPEGVNCTRCANTACVFNGTPTMMLPGEHDPTGSKLRHNTCGDADMDDVILSWLRRDADTELEAAKAAEA